MLVSGGRQPISIRLGYFLPEKTQIPMKAKTDQRRHERLRVPEGTFAVLENEVPFSTMKLRRCSGRFGKLAKNQVILLTTFLQFHSMDAAAD
jgi:hypothetical protein